MQAGTGSIIRSITLCALGGMTLAAQAPDPRIVLENDSVKVLKVTEAGHHKTTLHEHKANRVMIYLQAGKQTFDYQGGKPVLLAFKPGEALWSPMRGMHTAELTSAEPVTIVEIELKKAAGSGKVAASAMDPLKVDKKHYKLEFENPQVRVVRVKIGAHESTPMHEHPFNRVVTYLTDHDFRITAADGKVTNAQHKAAEVSWGVPGTHKEENLSDKPFEVVMVEIKN